MDIFEQLQRKRAYHAEWRREWRKKNPEREASYKAEYRKQNRERINAYQRDYAKKWYRKNHERCLQSRRRYARRKAGCLNPSGESKIGQCPICHHRKKLFYDHDHETGKHRGWICNACNWRLGWLEMYRARIEEYLGFV